MCANSAKPDNLSHTQPQKQNAEEQSILFRTWSNLIQLLELALAVERLSLFRRAQVFLFRCPSKIEIDDKAEKTPNS
jgi:hypothetical protein